MNWYFKAFENYFNFKGRARRKEFWFFILFQLIILFIISIIQFDLFYNFFDEIEKKYDAYILMESFIIITLIPSLSLTIRRFHDSGRSGLWVIALFFPIISFFALAYLLISGDEGKNKYGENPKNEFKTVKINSIEDEDFNNKKENLENEILELERKQKRTEILELEKKLENLKKEMK